MYHPLLLYSLAALAFSSSTTISFTNAAAALRLSNPSPVACTASNYPNCNQPSELTAYFCENTNWGPPCYLYRLDPSSNGASYEWKGAVDAWPDGKWTVGSLGPSKGISLTLYNTDIGPYIENATSLQWPGNPNMPAFWRDNIVSFDAAWDPGPEPAEAPV